MNILTRSMLWTIWLLSMRQIVYLAREHVKLYHSIQSDGIYGASCEYTTAETTHGHFESLNAVDKMVVVNETYRLCCM